MSWGRFTTPGATFFSSGVVEAQPGQMRWLPSPFPIMADLSAEERQQADFILIYPTHLSSALPDGMFYGQVLPQGPDRITWSLTLCFPPATIERSDFDHHLQQAVEGLEFINSQDMWACRSVQQGLASRFARPGRLGHLDQAIHIAVISERGSVKRQQPNAGDPHFLQVVQFLRSASEIADAITVLFLASRGKRNYFSARWHYAV